MPTSAADVPSRTDRAIALGGGGIGLLAVVGSSLLRAVDGLGPAPSAVAAVAFLTTGTVLGLRRAGSVTARLLLLTGLSLALANLFADWARHTLVAQPGSLPGGELTLWLGSWVWAVGYSAVAVLLPLRLPDGDLLSPRWRWAWRAGVALTVLAPLAWAVTPYDQMDVPPLEGLPEGITSPVGSTVGPILLAVSLPLVMVGALVGLSSLVLRLRRSDGEERQQLKWVALGAGLTLVLLALFQLVGPDGGSDLLLASAVLPLPLSVAVAGMRYRLWDVDWVIRRASGYVVLTLLVVAVYAVAVVVLGDLVGRRSGAPLVATVVVALLAEPARRRVQRVVDRVTRGVGADPYRTLVELGDRLESVAAAPRGTEAVERVAEAVRQALGLPWAHVEVTDGPSAGSGTPPPYVVEVPLVHGGELVGRLLVAPRTGERSARPGDLRLLQELARPVAVAAHAAQLRDALQVSRERIVVAREEERRRLRHDLHDDLGPLLAAVALHLGEVRSQLEEHPAAAMAGRAERLMTDSVATLRGIVDGLRPAALDDLGLTEALKAVGERFRVSGLEVDVALRGDLGGLPAAVEVATLRIATEALSNAARHAGAHRLRLGVERLDRSVEVTVADDGTGLGPARAAGVGLQSMRERAEEIGGSCTVISGASGGTVVAARLPVPVAEPAAVANATPERVSDEKVLP
ncbi:sensor histidine kinase [Nocardioides sp. STR2]|uniref:Oxygen sensor histidine kinase NreB n=1 Tax=Nocardioides pini TaxID=2975053 RepID=A0ABT4CBV3_9ACTN|nr:sensor histidine kinase [Nocardioides pini]MCY4726442.1 sensor histidine kinase [Nocardioides pini]